MNLKFVCLLLILLISTPRAIENTCKKKFKKGLAGTVPIISEECLEKGYCEDVPNYPEELASHIIQELERQGQTFINAVNSILNETFTVGNKISLCKSRRELVYPKAARDIHGKWRFILNQKENPIQGFVADVCVNKDGQCEEFFKFSDSTNKVYERRCQQQKTKVHLLSFDIYNRIEECRYPINCCCSCQPAVMKRLMV